MKSWAGQNFPIENRAGGNATIGSDDFAKFQRAGMARSGKIIAEAGIKVE